MKRLIARGSQNILVLPVGRLLNVLENLQLLLFLFLLLLLL